MEEDSISDFMQIGLCDECDQIMMESDRCDNCIKYDVWNCDKCHEKHGDY